MAAKRHKTTKRKTRKRTKRKRPAIEPDFPEPTFEPDPDDQNSYRIGRPPVELDPQQVFRVARCHSTYEEMAFILGCSVATLQRRFATVISLARSHEKVSLRRLQFAIAYGSTAPMGDRRKIRFKAPSGEMAKWLGKQHLGQRDQIKVQQQEVKPQIVAYIPDNGRGMVDASEMPEVLGYTGDDPPADDVNDGHPAD